MTNDQVRTSDIWEGSKGGSDYCNTRRGRAGRNDKKIADRKMENMGVAEFVPAPSAASFSVGNFPVALLRYF
jgi:hypothetical protein